MFRVGLITKPAAARQAPHAFWQVQVPQTQPLIHAEQNELQAIKKRKPERSQGNSLAEVSFQCLRMCPGVFC